MEDEAEILQQLPVDVINDIRLAAAVCFNLEKEKYRSKQNSDLIKLCNRALELKQQYRWRGFNIETGKEL